MKQPIKIPQKRSPHYRTIYIPEWADAVNKAEKSTAATGLKVTPNAIIRQAVRVFLKIKGNA